MSLHGTLRTLALDDLLRWAHEAEKTGLLELEQNKVVRRIELSSGSITACASDDPPSLLGQFLLARGKITREQLQAALDQRGDGERNIGELLVETGAVTHDELAQQIAAKAEETIRGLFEWDDAVFRFHDGRKLEAYPIRVELSVQDVLEKGRRHREELLRLRETFGSVGAVLEQTDKQPPKELDRGMARRIFESVDGERTLAEVVEGSHASEFLILKLLHRLLQMGIVQVRETRPVPAGPPLLVDGDASASSKRELDLEVDVASRLIQRGEHVAALELLNAAYRAHPEEDYLRRLIFKAETAYVEMRQHDLPKSSVPVLRLSSEELASRELSSDESFLVSLLDGRADVKAILWLAPMREVETLKALHHLMETGVVTLEPSSHKSDGTICDLAAELDLESLKEHDALEEFTERVGPSD